jgi:hypothetical protein
MNRSWQAIIHLTGKVSKQAAPLEQPRAKKKWAGKRASVATLAMRTE